MYQRPKPTLRRRRPFANLGFLRTSIDPLGPDEDHRTVELMRQVLAQASAFVLMPTVGGGWGTSHSSATIDSLARLSLLWHNLVGRTSSLDDRSAYAELRDKEIVPIAAGEHEHDLAGFEQLVGSGSVDVVQADDPIMVV